jgi:Putative beta-barrel porin 2
MSYRAAPFHRNHFVKSVLLLVATLAAGFWTQAYAQDAIRPSLAGQDAYDARQEDVSRIPYNLLLGPVRFRVGATVGVEYNDNINYAEVHTEDDVIVTPGLTLDMIWPVTQLNTLRLDLGLAYSFYLDHSNRDTDYLLVAPKSQLAFDIFVGDFRINLHDRMQLQQDPVQEGALSNVTDYGRFENTAGISILWDLNKILLQVGYDHYNFVATNDDFDYLNRNAEIVGGSAAFIVNPTLTVGAEGNAVFTRYDNSNGLGILSDNKDYSAGGFVELALTNNLKIRAAGGYQWIDFDQNFVTFFFGPFAINFPDHQDSRDYYANILVSHRLNAQISQTLSAGHETQLGVDSNYITLNYIRHTVSWNILRNTLLTTEFFFEDAEESGGEINESFQRIGGAVTLGYQLTPHVTLGVRYQGTSKDSDVFLRDYNQNRVSVDGTYSF